ncbi:MAG: winged helix-turn-helix domain-containing protein [Burkholderiaceae bacterium]|nr:winged helix-turn-helix domain-containing protein [Burkholderiaceae bacterium]
MTETTLRIGDWTLNPHSGELVQGETRLRLEQRTLRLLMCLIESAGEVLSADAILKQVWPDVVVSPDSVYQAITVLRRQLGDDSKNPAYIVTVPRRGYRLIAATEEIKDTPVKTARYRHWLVLSSLLLTIVLAVAFIPRLAASRAINPRAIAVLPFQDLTDQMGEEPFADGMTEELLSQLAKAPGVIISPPSAQQDVKDKHLSNAELAKTLHVAFILEGSVRKSGNTLRVAARLTRASDGFIAWSESYDRSWDDKLMIQEDIAGEVSKALSRSVH